MIPTVCVDMLRDASQLCCMHCLSPSVCVHCIVLHMYVHVCHWGVSQGWIQEGM